METLRSSDLRAALEFAERLLDVRSLPDVERSLLPGLAELLRSDMAVYHHVDLVELQEVDLFWPRDLLVSNADCYSSVMHQHPFVKHFSEPTTLPAQPVLISDVLSDRQWRASACFNVSHKVLGAYQQMTVLLARRRTAVRAVSLARERPGYRSHERALLALLRPHLLSAIRRAYLRSDGLLAIQTVPTVELVPLGRVDPVLARTARVAESLTSREHDVLELVAAGLTNAQVARRLGVAPGTVAKHLEHVYAKLGVDNRVAALQVLWTP